MAFFMPRLLRYAAPSALAAIFSFAAECVCLAAAPASDPASGSASGGITEIIFRDSVIGSMLFGYPNTGLGAADMAAAALLIFLLFKTAVLGGRFTARAKTEPDSTAARAEAMWLHLRGAEQPVAGVSSSSVSGGFAKEEFLEGARVLYGRLQNAWAARDVESLRPFVTPAMMEALEEHAEAEPEPSYVEVIMVSAELAGVEKDGDDERAVAAFTALLRDAPDAAPSEVKELWHFARGKDSEFMWRLDGVEQVAGTPAGRKE